MILHIASKKEKKLLYDKIKLLHITKVDRESPHYNAGQATDKKLKQHHYYNE